MPVKISYALPEKTDYDERETKAESYRITYLLHF